MAGLYKITDNPNVKLDKLSNTDFGGDKKLLSKHEIEIET